MYSKAGYIVVYLLCNISFARFSIEINGYLSLAKLFLKCNFHEEEKYLGQLHVSTKLLSSVVFKMFRGKVLGRKYVEDE